VSCRVVNSGDELQVRLEGFTDFLTLVAAFEDAFKKAQHIRQVEPKAAVDTFGIQPTRNSGIVPFDQHHTLASQTFHERTKLDISINKKISKLRL
jgi:hypothetical protein